MLMWIYNIWETRHHTIPPIRKLELEIIDLKRELNKKDIQINKILDTLETLTNESKTKFNYLNENNNAKP